MALGRIEIKIVSADLSNEETPKNPYVQLEMKPKSKLCRTGIEFNTFEPVWDEIFSHNLSVNEVLTLSVFNYVENEKDEMIGQAEIQLDSLLDMSDEDNSRTLTQELQPNGVLKLSIMLEPVPMGEQKPTNLKRRAAIHQKIHLHNGHSFVAVFFNQPTYCAHDHKFIWGVFGKQGYKCQNCHMTVHKKCHNLSPTHCVGYAQPEYEDQRHKALKIDIPHDFRSFNNLASFCDHCGRMVIFKGYKCSTCNFISHKNCKAKFPNNCGLDEEQFAILMKTLNIDPQKQNSIEIKTSEEDEIEMRNLAEAMESLERNGSEFMRSRADLINSVRKRILKNQLYNTCINRTKLEDLQLLSILGSGAFGKVYLAEHLKTNQIFAVKAIEKESIIRGDDIDVTMAERRILSLGTESNFLTSLHSSFQTPESLFFVMEYVSGGDLMFHIMEKGKFSPEQTKLYAAEIALALMFLHDHKIIYRDLKLDNVMIDKEGHIKLTDFGMCKENMKPEDMTNTFCGTPDYIAPEILLTQTGKLYGMSVDWWSFGILVYEMLSGISPFGSDSEDEGNVYHQILHSKLRFPNDIKGSTRKFIEELLVRDPTKRLGCHPKSETEIKKHDYFKNINWKDVEERKVKPQFIPETKDEKDTSNFDPEFTNEKLTICQKERQTIEFEEYYRNEFEGFSFVNSAYVHNELHNVTML